MLALVAMAGQAQIKSGLDLCLRDETTGQWLIGLFDEYAIYDCNYWDYAEVGKGRVVLTKDGLRKDIQLKKNANEASDTIDTFLVVDERIRYFE